MFEAIVIEVKQWKQRVYHSLQTAIWFWLSTTKNLTRKDEGNFYLEHIAMQASGAVCDRFSMR